MSQSNKLFYQSQSVDDRYSKSMKIFLSIKELDMFPEKVKSRQI
jgi:hypothetical protein